MTQLTIIANVRGAYRRGGLDLSNGNAVHVAAKDLTKEDRASLDSDTRVSVTEVKPVTKKQQAAKAKKINSELAAAKKEAGGSLTKAKADHKAALVAVEKLPEAEREAAALKAEEDLATAQQVRDDAVSEAETTANDERQKLGLGND